MDLDAAILDRLAAYHAQEPSRLSASLQLYLMRHGETRWSITGQHTGFTDLALTPHGEEQAQALAPSLEAISFEAIFTSPLLRARQTCEWAGLGRDAQIEADLHEWDYGDYEGKTTREIHRTRPDWNLWNDGCPGGEMPVDVTVRADRVLARLRTLSGNVALFTHGQFGTVLGTRWIGLEIRDAQHFVLSPASISCLVYQDGHSLIPAIASWNSQPPLLPPLRPSSAASRAVAAGTALRAREVVCQCRIA